MEQNIKINRHESCESMIRYSERKEAKGEKKRSSYTSTSSLVYVLQRGDRTEVRKEWTDKVKYGWSGLEND